MTLVATVHFVEVCELDQFDINTEHQKSFQLNPTFIYLPL